MARHGNKGVKKQARKATRTKPRVVAPNSLDKEFQAQDDLGTLRRAEEIRTVPARMQAARVMAKKQMAILKKV